jgi:hypothetical protein
LKEYLFTVERDTLKKRGSILTEVDHSATQ